MSDEEPEDSPPELPFQREWGELVARARKDKKLSQTALADRVGVQQAMISYIESYQVHSSTAVIAIARELEIPLPKQYFDDELEERWMESGRVLRRINEPGFRGLLTAAESMIANHEDKPH